MSSVTHTATELEPEMRLRPSKTSANQVKDTARKVRVRRADEPAQLGGWSAIQEFDDSRRLLLVAGKGRPSFAGALQHVFGRPDAGPSRALAKVALSPQR